MRRRRFLTIAAIAALVIGLVSTVAVAQSGGRPGRGMAHPAQGMRRGGPVFTEEQKEEIKEIHERYEEERVELANRASVLRLEMVELLGEDEIDFADVEEKIEEVHAIQLERAKLRLRIHMEVRPLLTDDQRELFDRGLARLGDRMQGGARGRGMRGGRMGMHGGRGMHPRCGMGGGMMGGPGGGAPRWMRPDDMEDDD
ncbi:MAG: periplasmic heavy metal sensor [Candidatus Eisenbacteria bacterium]|nr:periplasmic heavy metal sensor [Candidatus Eisenbacteria bacterium]